MFEWVRALLDPIEIAQSPATAKKQITPPPKFEMPSTETLNQLVPTVRTRGRRSVSPSKTSSPRKAGSPRKSRQTRAAKETSAPASSPGNAASAALQLALNTAASVAESESADGTAEQKLDVNGTEKVIDGLKPRKETKIKSKKAAAAPADARATEDAESTTETPNDIKTTEVIAAVEAPVLLPDLPPTVNTEEMIAQAKQMVEEATKPQQADAEGTEAPSTPDRTGKKRKSDELGEQDEENNTELPAQPTKRAKILEDKLRRERVRNRALIGVTATLALA
jgi:hypothetical protein